MCLSAVSIIRMYQDTVVVELVVRTIKRLRKVVRIIGGECGVYMPMPMQRLWCSVNKQIIRGPVCPSKKRRSNATSELCMASTCLVVSTLHCPETIGAAGNSIQVETQAVLELSTTAYFKDHESHADSETHI